MTSAHPQCLLGRVVGPSPDPKARAALTRIAERFIR